MKRKTIIVSLLALSLSGLITSCDSPTAFTATRLGLEQATSQTIRANLTAGQSAQTVQIIEPEKLPENLRNSSNIKVSIDNTSATSTVTRNADGTFTFFIPSSTRPESDGSLAVILIADDNSSQLIKLNTGPLSVLNSPGIKVGPDSNVIKGTTLTLEANLADSQNSESLDYNWFFSNSSTGPWQSISGNQLKTTWEPVSIGSFYIRLDMKRAGFVSSHISPTPVVLVRDSDTIASISPDGIVRQGDNVNLKVNIPELKGEFSYNWSLSQSPQGPFQPLSDTGAEVKWEADFPGRYYVRIKATNESQSTTYTSSKALISVSDSDDLFNTTPASGNIIRGEALTLSATIPNAPDNLTYNWAFSTSRQVPFAPIDGNSASIKWLPKTTGEFLIQLKTFDPTTNESKTYNTSKSIVSVQDSDDNFQVSPASISKGEVIALKLNQETSGDVLWSYGLSPQGPFTPMPGNRSSLNWTPPTSGSFFLKAEVINEDKSLSTFASATALVNVGESSGVIRATSGNSVNLGDIVQLAAEVPNSSPDLRYSWSYSQAPTGPWTALEPQTSQDAQKTLNWLPSQEGSFFLKVDALNPTSQSVVSFVSPTALVFVKDDASFFKTTPLPANIGINGAVTLDTNFKARERNYIYSWSYALAPTGPFTAIGGSLQPRITWKRPGLAGNFYVKFNATDTETQRVTSFISRIPLVFVTGAASTSTTTTIPTGFTF